LKKKLRKLLPKEKKSVPKVINPDNQVNSAEGQVTTVKNQELANNYRGQENEIR